MNVSLEVVGNYMTHLIKNNDVAGLLGGMLCQLPSHAHRSDVMVETLPIMKWLGERLEMDDFAQVNNDALMGLQFGLDGIDRTQCDVADIGEILCCGDYECTTTIVANTLRIWGALEVGSDLAYSINEVNGTVYIALTFVELASFGGSTTSCTAVFKLKDGQTFNPFK